MLHPQAQAQGDIGLAVAVQRGSDLRPIGSPRAQTLGPVRRSGGRGQHLPQVRWSVGRRDVGRALLVYPHFFARWHSVMDDLDETIESPVAVSARSGTWLATCAVNRHGIRTGVRS